MEAVASPTVSRAAIGFGGTHYCAGFNKIQLQGDIAMSHVCPKYHVMKLDTDLVQQMLDMTKEEVDVAILDWKGMNSDEREHVIKILDNLKVPWERAREYR